MMKLFQVCFGYISLAAVLRLFLRAIGFSSLAINLATLLVPIFLRIRPLEGSNYPFGFQVQSRLRHLN